mgnify:CR=1 FL=1
MSGAEVNLTLYNAALAEKERCSVPALGHSTDRRTLGHVQQVFREDNIQVLMCFLCACKEIAYDGYDKFGSPVRKGNIAFRSNKDILHQILCGNKEDSNAEEAWEYNLSAKRFKNRFGSAVSTDPGMQNDSFEWFRRVRRHGGYESILCCPEDVQTSKQCSHNSTSVCKHCLIPICNECYDLSLHCLLYTSPSPRD